MLTKYAISQFLTTHPGDRQRVDMSDALAMDTLKALPPVTMAVFLPVCPSGPFLRSGPDRRRRRVHCR
jgi:hypothetical protein